ncbi:polyribonucleotide nucleotidyltransferase [bacterium]|nr:polyribonucleotide nucleotidyltransferase [bacterium]
MFQKVQHFEKEIGGKNLIIETGKIADQTNGSCTVQFGETLVLATAVLSDQIREGVDYLPLLVDYEEKLYAAGKIKGSRFIKREGRPTDEAILTGRLIDRAIRPLFNESIRNDIQVIISVLSFDQKNDPDIVSLIAASCALAISNIPWAGPIAGVRVGEINGELVLNPSYLARQKSNLDLVVAGTGERVIMLEAGAKEISEEGVFRAIQFGKKHIGKILSFIREIQKEVGREKDNKILEKEITSEEKKLEKKVKDYLEKNLDNCLFKKELKTKIERQEAIEEFKQDLDKYLEKEGTGKEKRVKVLKEIKEKVEERISEMILAKEKRIDGRKLEEIRPLKCEVGYLPHTHGSGLFSRGETQILSIVTLGGPGEEQFLDTMEEERKKRFFHHYNFPPFSVGSVAPMRGPGRREIGHGALVERALVPLLPSKDKFPYTVRVVSEVLSSNGSSSMGSVCASSLALMDAGVPIEKAVAGVAIGLVSKSDEQGNIKNYKILTDIQDLEDYKGGMDFKVAGTKDGITAIQMDTKTHGLTDEIIKETLKKARRARLEILEKMKSTIAEPRKELSPYAPRVVVINIDPAKIREVIGPGGRIINEIIDETEVDIDIEQNGCVTITSNNQEGLNKAEEWIKNLTREIKVGEIFKGRVTRILDFGAFVEILPGQEGLVHISELVPFRVRKVEDVVKVGDVIPVKVIKIDEQGRINLSLKAARKYRSNGDKSKKHRHF